ncbi:MAG TPA: hypothetical protein VGN41_18100 [Streptosporangiaceae bacterium]
MRYLGRKEGNETVSPAAKLCGFLLLLAAIFTGAHAAGARLGPVTTSQYPAGTGGAMNMGSSGPVNMGGNAPAAPGRNGRP